MLASKLAAYWLLLLGEFTIMFILFVAIARRREGPVNYAVIALLALGFALLAALIEVWAV
jgi:hypothetical protein